MRQSLTILFLGLFAILSFSSTALAEDKVGGHSEKNPGDKKVSVGDTVASNAFEFTPDGLVRDVFNLMTGIQRPIDGSTSVTIQAGKSLRVGLTF